MIRTFAAIACLVLAGGFASAGERSLAHDAAHEDDRDQDSAVAKLRLQQMLLEIKERQSRLRVEIEDHRLHHEPHIPRGPQIGDSAVVVIEKCGYATVKHTIAWRQYPADELEVALSASDASLIVPDKLVLEFEKHQFRFEYQVKAGNKTGEFAVTLTPKAGNPVTVKVLVK